MGASTHDASAAATGYLYQFQWALLQAVRAYPDQPDRRLSLEKLDDVGWEDETHPTDLTQVKHHGGTTALTDHQDDVWRTIASWLDHGPPEAPGAPRLTLVTTAVASPGSAMALLRASDAGEGYTPAVEQALGRLERVAGESRSQVTAAARERFLGLRREQRELLMARVRVLDGALPVQNMREELIRALGHAVPTAVDSFLDSLLGWWGGVVLDLLQKRTPWVRVLDVHERVSGLLQDYGPDSLPTTVHEADVRELASAGGGQLLAQQLSWVGASPRYVELALIDFYRAYEQRTRWVEDELVGRWELDLFEERLREEWERAFEATVSRLPAGSTEQERSAAGFALADQLLQSASVLLRSRYHDGFLARGTRHALANHRSDDSRIGWHPDFRSRVEQVLLGSPA
ncbi:ABC-three component system protein [Pseudokineococcus sp. 5B2Z-1]|uniref:ABC-three component system protein n=1 Tax=Pseudokineococcus sp. 5B2Z-1 TaxID=3132744 RepID=UPI00309D45CB